MMASPSKPEQWLTPLSVSRVLDVGYPVAFGNQEAMDRGTAIHQWSSEWEAGHPFTLQNEEWFAYGEQYKRAANLGWDWQGVEERFDCPDLGFHGFVDRRGRLRSKATVLELKTARTVTGSSSPRTPIQLAAYTTALVHLGRLPGKPEDIQRVELRLAPDDYRIIVWDSPHDFAVWEDLLADAWRRRRPDAGR